MMRSLYIAKTGMDSSQFRLDVTSNNLANVNTKGFKRSNAVFEDLYYQTLRQPGSQIAGGGTLPTGLQVGTGSAAVASARIHSQGNLVRTEQTFDMAIVGDGFFRVQMPDGIAAYTRNGEFKRNEEGTIVNSAGYALDPAITIPSDASQVSISDSGVVQYFIKGNPDPVVAGTIQTASFINPQGLESLGENLYLPTAASGAAIEGDPGTEGRGKISQGYLEDSNVNVTEELINMIQAQRAFEMNSKAIKTADEMLQRVAQL
ncbi:flagellar basal-body rod protein FlgG [Craterilacuibacter sinensis]|uniref:Flagellar basal-body rod protein FlgG n=1 Tax=Craterilacuibacter sinensis TaxID=2686017 RepID=A0A845BQT3_9NEIS|nr:flagellar basal-body rod protein FlgG [Craterilacuibacter sinensis]MXR36821.1 flagellar basal-body rod protein FlgG [Craterilacuibacter sinensis]RQW29207.1 flagellar basal-body rod protein FlgG [Rhodobacteraceae bacterium CH30]